MLEAVVNRNDNNEPNTGKRSSKFDAAEVHFPNGTVPVDIMHSKRDEAASAHTMHGCVVMQTQLP